MDGTTSIRIISVDHYQSAPVIDLDPCCSRFRGSPVKQVPVIRIFGSLPNGEKICLHVHSVLPYIYIPYDSTIPQTEHDRFVYQTIGSLEKAINITLGKSSGKDQHIYEVQHVKGIPFYGYHPKEHQFLKIQFYNPFLTKKSASLLQNAAICGRVLQSFESHIPYILQFFMDYNLYGMSFVHVRTENLVFRVPEEEQEGNRLINTVLTKATRCKFEADIKGEHILNYLSVAQSSQRHQNPGISFIWDDEIERRKILEIQEPVELPLTQDRPKATVTETDSYFKAVLISKLESSQDNLNSTRKKSKRNKFNLPGLLGDAVYPAECYDDSLMNASCLPHLSKATQASSGELSFLDETQLDEETVLSLSTRPADDTFDEDDLDLLRVLEELDNLPEPIDDDSILAPLSQKPSSNPSSQLNRSQRIVHSQNLSIRGIDLPSDDEDQHEEDDQSLNALNLTLMDTQSEDFPQMDGNDDTRLRSTAKNEINFEPKSKTKSAKKSRYAPLNIIVTRSPRKPKVLEKCKSESLIALPSVSSSSRKSPRSVKNVNYSQVRPKHPNKIDEDLLKEKFNIKNCSVVLDKLEDSSPEKSIDREPSLPLALIYDLENGITAEPGPSKVNHRKTILDSPIVMYDSNELPSPILRVSQSDSDDEGVEPGVESFYDKSIFLDDSVTGHEMSMTLSITLPSRTPSQTISDNENPSIRITPLVGPPEPNFVKSTYNSYGLFDHLFEKPYYSDPKDVTRKRDVGGVLLEIKTKNYCEPFQSVLGLQYPKRNATEDLSRKIRITPYAQPPSLKDAELWLKARLKMQNEKKSKDLEITEESPVKMKREKTLLVLDGDELEDSTGLHFKEDPNLSLNSTLQPIDLNSSIIDTTPEAINSIKKMRYSSNLKSRDLRKSCYKLGAAKKLNLSGTILEDSDSCDLGVKPLSSQSQSEEQKLDADSIGNISLLKDSKYLNLSGSSFQKDESQFSQPTLNNTYGFKMDLENLNDVKVKDNHNHLVIFSFEVHCETRGKLLPDPEHDSIAAVFYAISNDSEPTETRPANVNGVIIVQRDGHSNPSSLCGMKVNGVVVSSEVKLIEKLIEVIYFWDPDILTGYEIELSSWGYLISRGQVIGINVPSLLSRVILKKFEEVRVETATEDAEDDFQQQLKIHGRIVLDVWRLMRNEINLMSYSFENIMYHIMHRRYPKHSHAELTKWWKDSRTSWIVLQYYIQRSRGSLEILDQLDLIGRTCELAKLFGIQFFEVLSRGSQFRVESMMLRMAKPRNFIPISPSVQQRVHMRAPEYLPLILEPESRFYVDPVIVLDFQSLYPSMMIAYNYCFSTCLGRVEHLGESAPFEFGASQLQVSTRVLKQLLKADLLTVSPAGVAFVKSAVREGTVPRLLKEILDTRIMVKNSMKLHKNNKLLQRVLHSRQLGLKLIANVTYGYTAANYSGRMSCVEVADSILSKARETLERAIKLVDANNKWNVKVVYGDTDSMFVLVPGRTKEEAFAIGEEIATMVTEDNPNPVKLKLEKVYQPCILQTKKRYVGFMYETKDQKEPVYEAKGIETVRRDGCPIVARMLEKVLRILFETKDVSLIKQYVNREFTKIIGGKVNLQDLTFAREFRGMNGYKPKACVPAMQLIKKWKETDRRREPRSGERVPYVIANGPPGLPLIKLVRSPEELLADTGLKINSYYYIIKAIIPPLNRCLLLIGADVNNWFEELRRNNLIKFENMLLTKETTGDNQGVKKRSTISQYFSNTDCIVGCGRQTTKMICEHCRREPQRVSFVVNNRMQCIERKFRQIELICQSCCGRQYETRCTSLDCPILHVRTKRERKFQELDVLNECLDII